MKWMYHYLALISILLGSLAHGKVHPKVLEVFTQQYEQAHQKQQALLERYAKSPDSPAKEKSIREAQLFYLHIVMQYERDLRILMSSVDPISKDVNVKELSSSEIKKISKLRLEIHELETKRILSALKNKQGLYLDEKLAKEIGQKERDLDRLAKRNTSKLYKDQERSIRAIGKLKPDQKDRKAKLTDELNEIVRRLETINQLIYGYAADGSFEKSVPTDNQSAANQLLHKIVTERDQLLKYLRGEMDLDEPDQKSGEVGGIFVYGTKLGVVLDVSGSMTAHIAGLKQEIKKTFTDPEYREFRGCTISGRHLSEMYIDRQSSSARTILAVMDLVVVHRVDSIYWFCDLRDEVHQTGIRHLRQLLKRSGASFFVKSMSESPDRTLEPLITEFKN